MKNQNFAPVALFVYNRLEHTVRTIEALKNNLGAENTELFIFSDGPKTEAANESVDQVRKYVSSITGFKSVEVFAKDSNTGLAKSIIAGVTYMMEKYGQAIILEDDLVTSPHFLSYMNDALDLYRNDEKVISIHAYVYPTKEKLPELFFLRGADCWGWATWKRGWQHFEADGKKLLEQLSTQNSTKDFNFDNSYDYTGMLKRQVAGEISSWAIRWYASAFLKGKLTLYPGRSLVKNIGNDGTGTHCGDSSEFDVVLSTSPISVENIPAEENREARKAFVQYFQDSKPSKISRAKKHLQKLIKRVL